ncbi:MAG: hypothetical protein ACTSQY_03315, partial [Candidatus Odinarchaeia archaeon]
PQAYKDGIQRTSGWQQKAIEGEELYKQKLQESMAAGLRAKRIANVSDEQWKKAAAEKGSARIASGMAASKDKFNSGMAKNLSTIQNVSIPKRVADPMANIDNRLKPIAKALHDQKMQG